MTGAVDRLNPDMLDLLIFSLTTIIIVQAFLYIRVPLSRILTRCFTVASVASTTTASAGQTAAAPSLRVEPGRETSTE